MEEAYNLMTDGELEYSLERSYNAVKDGMSAYVACIALEEDKESK